VLFASQETPGQTRPPRDKRHRVIQGRCVMCYRENVLRTADCSAADIPRQLLSNRFDAIGARISAWRLLKGCLTPQERERMDVYWDICANPLDNAHGSYGWGDLRIASQPDIRSLADLEMEVAEWKPDVVFWDSAYLAAETTGRLKRKEAYDDLLVGFKEMLGGEGIPGTLSWHLKREVTEKAKDCGLGDTAYTDELGRLTDVVVATFRPAELQRAREAYLRTLKVRDGVRMPALLIHWDVKECIRFDEIRVGAEPGDDGEGKKAA